MLKKPFTPGLASMVWGKTTPDCESVVETFTASKRRGCLNRLADLIEQNAHEFAHLEALSMGKPVSAYVDAGIAVDTFRCRYYVHKPQFEPR